MWLLNDLFALTIAFITYEKFIHINEEYDIFEHNDRSSNLLSF